ncbi:hypothetical protein AURDEDRAFT_174190 [Auricularia subglabra TFB-10046 SS5]|nr:hypothetical protein AURDEDRAFT_174190 [Auricularia subglabra TFB-10046 SS5]
MSDPGSFLPEVAGSPRPQLALRSQRSRRERHEGPRRPGSLELALEGLDRDDDTMPGSTSTRMATPSEGMDPSSTRTHTRVGRQRIIYIGNLPQSVTRDAVLAHFLTVGKVKSCVVSCCKGYVDGTESSLGRPAGEYMAVVEFVHPYHADKAVRRFHETNWLGRTIVVSFSPWDTPTGLRIRAPNNRPLKGGLQPIPRTHVRDMTVSRRQGALLQHLRDGRLKRDEQIERMRADRLKLGGGEPI